MRTRGRSCLLLATAAWLAACGSPQSDVPPQGDPPLTVEPDVPAEPRTAEFRLTIDPKQPEFAARTTLEPVASPITISGGSSTLKLRAFGKRLPQRSELLWVELFFENQEQLGLRDVAVEVKELSGGKLYDFTNDPFSEDDTRRSLRVGAIAAEGLGRVVIGVPASETTSLTLRLAGTTTRRVSQGSGPIKVSPDGAEVWVAWPDADLVAVLDAGRRSRIAELRIPGRPSSVAITPDGKLVLVASAATNTITVLNRADRSVVQTLGEADGIGREPRHLTVSPDGARAFVSAFVGDSITALARRGNRYVVESSLAVGRRPAGLSVSPDGTLYVSHFLLRGKVTANEGYVSVLATAPLALLREAVFHDHFNLKEVKCLSDLLKLPPELFTAEGAPTQFAGAFLNPAGTLAWVPGARVGPIPIWERGPKAQALSPFVAPRPGEILAPFLFLLDTRDASSAAPLAMPGVLDPPDARIGYVKCAKYEFEGEQVRRNVLPDMPLRQVNTAAATPTGSTGLTESGPMRSVAFSRGGRLFFGVSHTADEIIVYDALTLHPRTQHHAPLSGNNPLGIAMTPDGKSAFVVYENSTFVSVLDASAYASPADLPGPTYVPYDYRDVPQFPSPGGIFTSKRLVRYIASVPDLPALKEVAQIPLVDKDPVDPVLRRGAVLFTSGNPDKHPTLSASRNGACASCHPDGHSDGTLWPTMEGERRTMSLAGGVEGRGWLHASGTHSDAAEFAEIIVTERLGGKLAKSDITALATYVAKGIRKLQGPRVNAELAARGKTIFQAKCAGCHAGPQLTSGRPGPMVPYGGGDAAGPGLYDLGTAVDSAFAALPRFVESSLPPLEKELVTKLRGDRSLGTGDRVQEVLDFRPRPDRKRGEFKAPSLINVWDSVVYFHDGRFETLAEVVGYLDSVLKLGLSADDKQAVIEYLKTL